MKRIFLVCFAYFCVSFNSFADTESGESLGTELVRTRVSASYFGIHDFPSIFQSGNPILSNWLFLNYRFGTSTFVGLVVGYDILPSNFEKSSFHSPAIRVGDWKLIDSKAVKMSGDLRFILPINDQAQSQKVTFALASLDQLSWTPFIDDLFLDVFAFFRFQTFSQDQVGSMFYHYNRTGVNYQVTQTFGISLAGIMQFFHFNRPNVSFLDTDTLRVGPGVFVKYKGIQLNSYLTFKTTSLTLNDSNFVFFASAKLF